MPDPIETAIIELQAIRENLKHAGVIVNEGRRTPLSALQLEILRLSAEGYTAEEIATAVYRSRRTVESIRRDLCRLLSSRNVTQAVWIAAKRGWLE